MCSIMVISSKRCIWSKHLFCCSRGVWKSLSRKISIWSEAESSGLVWQLGCSTQCLKASASRENKTHWGWLSLCSEKIQENIISNGWLCEDRRAIGWYFHKGYKQNRVEYLCNKLGMINIYAPTWGWCYIIYVHLNIIYIARS